MNTRAITIIVLFLLAAASAQQTEKDFTHYVPGGFLNTGDFPDLPPSVQEGYAMGFFNGMMASGVLGADAGNVEALSECTKGMKSKQLTAILGKYVTDHPETWHQTLAVHSLDALVDVCPDLRKRLLRSHTASH